MTYRLRTRSLSSSASDGCAKRHGGGPLLCPPTHARTAKDPASGPEEELYLLI